MSCNLLVLPNQLHGIRIALPSFDEYMTLFNKKKNDSTINFHDMPKFIKILHEQYNPESHDRSNLKFE